MFYCGTSSWYFDDWRGVFYSANLPKNQALNEYAIHFNSVEVNTTFYGLPTPSTLLNWLDSVPPGFRFSAKFPRLISHEQRLVGCEPASRAFLDLLRALGPAAGVGFLQLPPTFTRSQNGRELAIYLDWLAGEMGELRLAVEVRSLDLMTEAFARFLAERGIALALTLRAGQPDLHPLWAALMDSGEILPFAFLRFIGEDGNPLPDDRELRRPQDALLDQWADRIANFMAVGQEVYAYLHNPLEGHSPASVRRLLHRVGQHTPLADWPPAGSSGPVQQMALF